MRMDRIRLEAFSTVGPSKILDMVVPTGANVRCAVRIRRVPLGLSVAPPSSDRWVLLREARIETLFEKRHRESRISIVADINRSPPKMRIALSDAVLVDGWRMTTRPQVTVRFSPVHFSN